MTCHKKVPASGNLPFFLRAFLCPRCQVKLLSILGVLGTADKATSEHMYEILQEPADMDPVVDVRNHGEL